MMNNEYIAAVNTGMFWHHVGLLFGDGFNEKLESIREVLRKRFHEFFLFQDEMTYREILTFGNRKLDFHITNIPEELEVQILFPFEIKEAVIPLMSLFISEYPGLSFAKNNTRVALTMSFSYCGEFDDLRPEREKKYFEKVLLFDRIVAITYVALELHPCIERVARGDIPKDLEDKYRLVLTGALKLYENENNTEASEMFFKSIDDDYFKTVLEDRVDHKEFMAKLKKSLTKQNIKFTDINNHAGNTLIIERRCKGKSYTMKLILSDVSETLNVVCSYPFKADNSEMALISLMMQNLGSGFYLDIEDGTISKTDQFTVNYLPVDYILYQLNGLDSEMILSFSYWESICHMDDAELREALYNKYIKPCRRNSFQTGFELYEKTFG